MNQKGQLTILFFGLLAIVVIFVSFLGFVFLNSKVINPEARTEKYGVLSGILTQRSGDCAPPITAVLCQIKPVAKKIMIRKVAYLKENNNDEITWKKKTKLITKSQSDHDGNFSIELPVGWYSFFVEDEKKEYCNFFGARETLGLPLCLFKIREDQITEFNFRIDKAIE